MTQLIVQLFKNDLDRATDVYTAAKEMVDSGQMKAESGLVVVRDYSGNIKMREHSDWTTGSGAAWGSLWGLIVGFIFAGPLVGLLGGMGLGAILGGSSEQPIDRDFAGDIAAAMHSGDSALFVAIDPADKEITVAKLKAFGGSIYDTSMSKKQTEELHKALEHSELAVHAEQEAQRQAKSALKHASKA